jgi:hypothetical protein
MPRSLDQLNMISRTMHSLSNSKLFRNINKKTPPFLSVPSLTVRTSNYSLFMGAEPHVPSYSMTGLLSQKHCRNGRSSGIMKPSVIPESIALNKLFDSTSGGKNCDNMSLKYAKHAMCVNVQNVHTQNMDTFQKRKPKQFHGTSYVLT